MAAARKAEEEAKLALQMAEEEAKKAEELAKKKAEFTQAPVAATGTDD